MPQVINTMAVWSMLLTQDRCTKNFLMYQSPTSTGGLWSVLAYDLKSAMGADAGLNGTPAKDYCILECPQWNSPLYCDRDHPQVRPTWECKHRSRRQGHGSRQDECSMPGHLWSSQTACKA